MCTWKQYMYKQTHVHGNLSIWRQYTCNQTGVYMEKIRVFLNGGIICTYMYYLYMGEVCIHGGSICTRRE